jgi:branched-chain amino acid transport system permease protein
MADNVAAADVISEQITPGTVEKSSSIGKTIFLIVLLLALFLFPLMQVVVGRFNYYIHLVLITLMWIAMASSWNILGGYTGYMSLGHNVFFGVGGYFSGILLALFGISVFLTAPLAGLMATAIGLLIGFITLRVKGPSFIISTIALLLLIKISFDNWDFIGGSQGLTLKVIELPVEFAKFPFYYGMLLTAIGAVYTSYRIRHSKLGLGLRAISQDEVKAEAAGIPTNLYKILAFAISAFFVGVVGSMWGHYLTYLRPNIFLLIVTAARMVLMSVLGGKGTIAGPALGAIIMIAVDEFFVSQFGATELNIAGLGVIMIVVLLFFPEGIVGTLRRIGRLPAILDWD